MEKVDWQKALRLGLGAAILAALVYLAGAREVAAALAGFNALYIFPVAALFLASNLLSALNLKVLFDARKKIGGAEFMRAFSLSFGVGLFAPGKIGDFSLAVFLRKHFRAAESAGIIFLDKAVTLTVLCAAGMPALFMLLPQAEATVATAGLALFWISFWASLYTGIFERAFSRGFLSWHGGVIGESVLAMGFFLRKEPARLAVNLFITVLKLLIQAAAFTLLFAGLGEYGAGLWQVLVSSAAAMALSFLPFTLGGLGVREGVYAYILSMYGAPISVSLASSLISAALSYAVAAAMVLLPLGKEGPALNA